MVHVDGKQMTIDEFIEDYGLEEIQQMEDGDQMRNTVDQLKYINTQRAAKSPSGGYKMSPIGKFSTTDANSKLTKSQLELFNNADSSMNEISKSESKTPK